MPVIPLYHHQSDLRSTSGPKANPHMHSASWQALGQVSAQVEQIGQKLQATNDYRAITEFQLKQQEFEANEAKWRMDNPNAEEPEILKRYETNRKAFNESQLKNKYLSREARERISAMAQEGYIRGQLQVTQQARLQGIKRAKAASDTVITQAIDQGDLQTITERIDMDIEHGIRSPESREGLLRQAQVQMEHNDAMYMINTDPIQAKVLLEERDESGKPTNYTALDEAKRYTLINHAERNAATLKAQTADALQERVNNNEVIPPDEIDELVAKGLLKPKTAKAFLKQQDTGKIDQAAFNQFYDLVVSYDPSEDPKGIKYAALKDHSLAFGHQGAEAKGLLESLRKGTSPLQTDVAKSSLKLIEEQFKSGFFGQFETEEIDKMGKTEKVTDFKKKALAEDNRIKAQKAMIHYLLTHPKATVVEAQEFYQKYQQDSMGAIADEIIAQSLPKFSSP